MICVHQVAKAVITIVQDTALILAVQRVQGVALVIVLSFVKQSVLVLAEGGVKGHVQGVKGHVKNIAKTIVQIPVVPIVKGVVMEDVKAIVKDVQELVGTLVQNRAMKPVENPVKILVLKHATFLVLTRVRIISNNQMTY